MRPTFYRGCWHVVSRDLFLRYRPSSSLRKEVYNPKAVVPHAALLHQASAHCPIFLTAAPRRSRDRVSVPVWLIVLSDQLPITALVGRYPANKLIHRGPIPGQRPKLPFPTFPAGMWGYPALIRVSPGYSGAEGRLSTCYSPVRRCPQGPKPLVLARLACVRRAASVRPEPGSNSP